MLLTYRHGSRINGQHQLCSRTPNVSISCIHVHVTSVSVVFTYTQRQCQLCSRTRNVGVNCVHVHAMSVVFTYTQCQCQLYSRTRNVSINCVHVYAITQCQLCSRTRNVSVSCGHVYATLVSVMFTYCFRVRYSAVISRVYLVSM